MPVDPWIARGVQAPDVRNTLAAVANLQLERQRTNALDQRNALLEQGMQAEQQQGADRAKLERIYGELQAVKRGPPEIQAAWLARQSQDPGFAQSPFANLPPEHALPMMEAGLASLLGRDIEQPTAEGIKFGAVNPGDYTPESLARYAQTRDYADLRRQYAPPQPVVINTPAYGAGLVSRATGAPIARFTTPEGEAAARATAEAGTTRAKAEAQAAGEREGKTADLEATYRLYETARDGLLSGLGASETGPVVGRIPAVTAAQQTAEGTVAAMAPVMKQLFRVAGEGVFTDRDQQLLIDMIPKRTDRPEARANKIANIDAIVQAKLKQQTSRRRIYDPNTGTIR